MKNLIKKNIKQLLIIIVTLLAIYEINLAQSKGPMLPGEPCKSCWTVYGVTDCYPDLTDGYQNCYVDGNGNCCVSISCRP